MLCLLQVLSVHIQVKLFAQVPVELPGPAGKARRAFWPKKVAIIGFGELHEEAMDGFRDCVHQLHAVGASELVPWLEVIIELLHCSFRFS